MRYCYINGEFFPSEKAVISVYDLGLLRGHAVFDYMRTHEGRLFRFHDHYIRFCESAASYYLQVPLKEEELKHVVRELLRLSELKDGGIRWILTGGYSADTMTSAHPNLIVMVDPLPAYDETIYSKGVKIISVEHARENPEVKSTGYLMAMKVQPARVAAGAFDVLYTDHGKVLELTRSNIFIVKDGVVKTPENGILKGITRKVVCELAEEAFPLRACDIAYNELVSADEVFMSGTSKKIIPVVQIDDRMIGDGVPGPVTKEMMRRFDAYVQAYAD